MRTSRIEQVGIDVDICDMLGQIGGCLGWAGKNMNTYGTGGNNMGGVSSE